MNDREKNAILLRELKTAISWQELNDNAKQLVVDYRDRVVNKIRNFFSLNEEEKSLLYKIPQEILSQIKDQIPSQITDYLSILKKNLPPELLDYIIRKTFPPSFISFVKNTFTPEFIEKILGEEPPPAETMERVTEPLVEEIVEPSEERKKEKEKEELEKREELAEVSPEAAILNTFAPEIYNYELFFNEESGSDVDASINAFSYLKAMGFTHGMWEIGPEHFNCIDEKGRDCCRPHKEIDPNTPICQVWWTENMSLDHLIDNAYAYANEKSFYPPKAIIAKSHPNCKCHVSCWIPTDASAIPDSAPSLPAFADPDELLYYKEQVLAKIVSYSQDGVSISIDRWTVLSSEVYGEVLDRETREDDSFQTIGVDWKKPNASQEYIRHIRAKEKWVKDIKPVIIRTGFIYKHAFGLIRPVPNTYFGIQVERNEKERNVFISDMSYTIKAPDINIEEVKIKPISSFKPEPGNFIKIDDTYGIIITVLPDNRVFCYLPEFHEKIFVEGGTIYEIA